MTKEEILEKWKTERTRAIDEMFDNPDHLGIYPTGKFFDAIDKAFETLSEEYAQQLAPSSEELCWLAWKQVYIINTHTGWEIGEDSPVHELHDWSMVKLEFDEWWERVLKSKDAPNRGDLEQAKAAHSSPSLKHLKELLKTIRQETIPFTGHPDTGSILDCWNEVFEILDEQPAQRATPEPTDEQLLDWIQNEKYNPENNLWVEVAKEFHFDKPFHKTAVAAIVHRLKEKGFVLSNGRATQYDSKNLL